MSTALALAMILGGISLAIVDGAIPNFESSSLPEAGSFFALADSGSTLYAASDNGGSILLEKSSDRGVEWTASPVPYSAVAGGAPWQYAVVAADGSELILAAATGGSVDYYGGPPGIVSPAAIEADLSNGTCGQDSIVLLAASPDGGLTWSDTTFAAEDLSITSLQAGVVGNLTAVAWLGETTSCDDTVGAAGAITSLDHGQSWSAVQNLSMPRESIGTTSGIEMAPELGGIVVAYAVTSTDGSSEALDLWSFNGLGTCTFAPMVQLAAPESWTLQGDPGTSAFLLTPTYLIPLTTSPYTAFPFNQLQVDGASIGALPSVVSLVSLSGGVVEIAATTSNDLGVDCWQVDLTTGVVEQTCHVPLDTFLEPSAGALPIVALLDGGGWWTAIGASGNPCSYACSSSNPGALPAPVAAPSNVGTSVCLEGCSSQQGLAAYSYTPGASTDQGVVDGLAALLAALGVAWLVFAGWRQRRRPAPSSLGNSAVGAGARGVADPEEKVSRTYRVGLAVWIIAWVPLVALAFLPASSGAWTALPYLAVIGGIVGALVIIPFHASVRKSITDGSGFTADRLFDNGTREGADPRFEQVRWASTFGYASWIVGGFMVLLVLIDLSSVSPSPGAPTGWGAAVLVLALAFSAFRVLYHRGLALAAAEVSPDVRSGVLLPGPARDRRIRTAVGAALLPWNPLVGLILGVALEGLVPWSPYLLAWAFLPITLTGLILLLGGFGSTVWSRPSLPRAAS